MVPGTDDRVPELVARPPSPLSERLAAFRTSGSDEPPHRSTEDTEADQPDPDAEDAPEPEETLEEEQEQKSEADEAAGDKEPKPEAGAEEDEDEAKAEGEEPPAKTFAIDIPTPGAEKGGPQGAILKIEGLPQEYRDAIAGHVKRSQQLDGALQRLEEARELETVATFYQKDPLNAMRLVAIEQPELAQEFVANWMQMHPKESLAIVRAAKFDSEDQEKLQLRGELAQRRMREELSTAYQGLEGQRAQSDFMDMARDTVTELAAPLDLADDATSDFAELAATRVKREMDSRRAQRQSPYLTKLELLTLLQPLVQKFGGQPGTKPGKKPLTPAEMQARKAKADNFRRLQVGGVAAAVRPTGTKKTRLPRDMGERIKLLRANKL